MTWHRTLHLEGILQITHSPPSVCQVLCLVLDIQWWARQVRSLSTRILPSKERRQTVNKQTNIKKVLDSHAYYKENKTRSYDSNWMATLDWAIGKDPLDGGIGAVTWWRSQWYENLREDYLQAEGTRAKAMHELWKSVMCLEAEKRLVWWQQSEWREEWSAKVWTGR